MAIHWKTYLTTQGAVFVGDQLTGFSTSPQEINSDSISVLSNHSLISVAGADRQKFLQGQISTHMLQLADLHHSAGVACSPNGRMYSNFRIMDTGERYLLSMNSGLTETTLETLKKYAVFFKVDLAIQPDYMIIGLSGDHIDTILATLFPNSSLPINDEVIAITNDSYLIKIPGNRTRYQLWLPGSDLPGWWPELTKQLTPATEAFWQLLNIESVTPELNKETSDKYIPQHLNQPSLGGVSFKKGCYTGQEIVTRMQTLGQQKSRCYWLTLNSPAEPVINARLYNGDGKPVGEIIQTARNIETNGMELLAVIRIDAAEANDVFMTAEKGQPLQVHELPYAIDQKTELKK